MKVIYRLFPYLTTALGYWLLAKAGLAFATLNSSASPVWPATGVALTAIIVWGPKILPAIAFGAFAANFESPELAYFALLIALGTSLESFAAHKVYRFVRKYFQDQSQFSESAAIIALSFAAPIFSATLGCLALFLRKETSSLQLAEVWTTWWVGDALGSMILTPLLLALSQSRFNLSQLTQKFFRFFLVLALTGASLYFVFLAPKGAAFLFILFPILLVSHQFLEGISTRFLGLIIAIFATAATLYGHGPFSNGTLNANLINLQLFLAAFSITLITMEPFFKLGPVRLPAFLLVTGWSISGLFFYSVYQNSQRDLRNNFEQLVQQSEIKIKNRLDIYLEVLRSGVSLFASSEEVNAKEWKTYIHSQNFTERFKGITGMGVIFPISKNETSSFQKRNRSHHSEFKVHTFPSNELSAQEDQFIITYIEPLTQNQEALGLDIGSEKNRRAAAELARDSGQAAMTKRIALVQDKLQRSAFLLFVPMYWKPSSTVEERRANFRGWIYAPILTNQVFESALEGHEDEIQLSIFEGDEIKPESLISNSPSPFRPEDFDLITKINFSQHNFTLGWIKAKLPYQDANQAWAAFCTSIITLLFSLIVATLQTTGIRAQTLADQKTKELFQRKEALKEIRERFELAVKGSHDGIWDWDIGKSQIYLSQRLLEILGFQEFEIQDNLAFWESSIHPEDKPFTNIALTDYLAKRAPTFEAECRIRHRDSSYRWVLLRGDALWNESARAYRMAGSLTDITVRKNSELELIRARKVAMDATQAKSQFLANISHEIRTPLSAILGTVNVLRGGQLSADQYDFVEVIAQSANVLLETINDVLDFSKIEAGKLTIEKIDFNLADLIEDVRKVIRFSAAQKGLQVHVRLLGPCEQTFRSDPIRIRQILFNLLGNAIKFSKQGTIVLTAKVTEVSHGQFYSEFTVSDQGIGISAAAKEKIFEAFTQADSSTTRLFGGTGLGLSICKRLVTLLEGTIDVQSIEGKGSVFSFAIPLLPGQSSLTLTSSFPEDMKVTRDAMILVADDNLINQRVTLAVLKQLGYQATGANNGLHAIELLAKTRFDLILMDCQMPELDGYEAAEKIRKNPHLNRGNLPIIAVTANAFVGDRERCLSAGMNDYIAKPVRIEKLIEVIENQLSKNLNNKKDFAVNRAVLESLGRSENLGGPDFLAKLIRLFSESAPRQVENMKSFFQNQDLKKIQKEAHSLKSSCSSLGLEQAARICQQLEDLKPTALNQSLALIDRLDAEVKICLEHLAQRASSSAA